MWADAAYRSEGKESHAPELVSAHVLKARALRRLGEETIARGGYEAALRIDPQSFDALLEQGNALRGLGWADEAAASYTVAMAARPMDARPTLALARLMEEQPGQDAAERAAIAFQKAPPLRRGRSRRWPVCTEIWPSSVWNAPICSARLMRYVNHGCWRVECPH